MDVPHNVYTYDFCVGIHMPTGCVSGKKKKKIKNRGKEKLVYHHVVYNNIAVAWTRRNYRSS